MKKADIEYKCEVCGTTRKGKGGVKCGFCGTFMLTESNKCKCYGTLSTPRLCCGKESYLNDLRKKQLKQEVRNAGGVFVY